MIKLFNKGLGIFKHPFQSNTSIGFNRIQGNPAGGPQRVVAVDHTVVPFLGNMRTPSMIQTVLTQPDPPLGLLQTTIMPPVAANVSVERPNPVIPQSVMVGTTVAPQQFSAESSFGPFDTLFHDFDLEAIPFYNFWTPDELTNDKEPVGDRKISDIPRFIKIVWNPAPDLPDSPIQAPKENGVGKRKNKPVRFSLEIEKGVSVGYKGVVFAPEHLQPVNFDQAVANVSNGYISPAIVEANVELPLSNTGLDTYHTYAQTDPRHHLDEDAFLAHPDTEGMVYHELKAQINQISNGVIGTVRIAKAPLSAQISQDKGDLYDGQFTVNHAIESGGKIQIHGSNISVETTTAISPEDPFVDNVLELIDRVVQPPNVNNVESTSTAKVRFVDPAIGGVVSESKANLVTKPEHAEAIVAVGQNLSNLECLAQSGFHHLTRNTSIPSFRSPAGLKQVEYIGYVLEKYQQLGGAFTKVDEIHLPDRNYDTYIDSKVAYGQTYRYRIRAIVRWTRPLNVGPFGPVLNVIPASGSQAAPLAQFQSSYFSSEWSAPWSYAMLIDQVPPSPPDELTVRPDSARKQVVISFKLPEDEKRDILTMRLYRKIQDQAGKDITGWSQVKYVSGDTPGDSVNFSPRNVLYIDTDVYYFQDCGYRYVYSAQCTSRHNEVSVLSDQLAVRLNAEYKARGEYPIDFVSCAGVRPEYFGSFSVYPARRFREELRLIPSDEGSPVWIVLSGRNQHGNLMMNDSIYRMDVESLDTGEVVSVPINVKYSLQKIQVSTLETGVYIPLHNVAKKIMDQAPASAPVLNTDLGNSSIPASVMVQSKPSGRYR